MYYAVYESGKKPLRSYGFAPAKHNSINGPGKTEDNDIENYQNPRFERHFEISKKQYDALIMFGGKPESFGFSLYYADVRNNCIDFVWNALRHARVTPLVYNVIDMDGEVTPKGNIPSVWQLNDQVPGSDLNKTIVRPSPKVNVKPSDIKDVEGLKKIFQKLLSQTTPQNPTESQVA